MKLEFPKWMYHSEKAPIGIIVNDEKGLNDLGDGWVETPADFEKIKKNITKDSEKNKTEKRRGRPKKVKV